MQTLARAVEAGGDQAMGSNCVPWLQNIAGQMGCRQLTASSVDSALQERWALSPVACTTLMSHTNQAQRTHVKYIWREVAKTYGINRRRKRGGFDRDGITSQIPCMSFFYVFFFFLVLFLVFVALTWNNKCFTAVTTLPRFFVFRRFLHTVHTGNCAELSILLSLYESARVKLLLQLLKPLMLVLVILLGTATRECWAYAKNPFLGNKKNRYKFTVVYIVGCRKVWDPGENMYVHVVI